MISTNVHHSKKGQRLRVKQSKQFSIILKDRQFEFVKWIHKRFNLIHKRNLNMFNLCSFLTPGFRSCYGSIAMFSK